MAGFVKSYIGSIRRGLHSSGLTCYESSNVIDALRALEETANHIKVTSKRRQNRFPHQDPEFYIPLSKWAVQTIEMITNLIREEFGKIYNISFRNSWFHKDDATNKALWWQFKFYTK